MLISIISACRLLAPQENLVLAVNWDQHFTAYIRELEMYRYNSAVGGLSDAIHQDNRMAGIQFNLPYSIAEHFWNLQSNFRKCPYYQMNHFLGWFLSHNADFWLTHVRTPSYIRQYGECSWATAFSEYVSVDVMCLKNPCEVYILLNYKHKPNLQLWVCCLFIRTSPDLNLSISCPVAQFTLHVSTLLLLKFLSLQDKDSARDGKEEFISSRQSLFQRMNSTIDSHVKRGIVNLILCGSQMTVDIQHVTTLYCHLKCRVKFSWEIKVYICNKFSACVCSQNRSGGFWMLLFMWSCSEIFVLEILNWALLYFIVMSSLIGFLEALYRDTYRDSHFSKGPWSRPMQWIVQSYITYSERSSQESDLNESARWCKHPQ